jgi:hypothetical protein
MVTGEQSGHLAQIRRKDGTERVTKNGREGRDGNVGFQFVHIGPQNRTAVQSPKVA